MIQVLFFNALLLLKLQDKDLSQAQNVQQLSIIKTNVCPSFIVLTLKKPNGKVIIKNLDRSWIENLKMETI